MLSSFVLLAMSFATLTHAQVPPPDGYIGISSSTRMSELRPGTVLWITEPLALAAEGCGYQGTVLDLAPPEVWGSDDMACWVQYWDSCLYRNYSWHRNNPGGVIPAGLYAISGLPQTPTSLGDFGTYTLVAKSAPNTRAILLHCYSEEHGFDFEAIRAEESLRNRIRILTPSS